MSDDVRLKDQFHLLKLQKSHSLSLYIFRDTYDIDILMYSYFGVQTNVLYILYDYTHCSHLLLNK